MRHRKVLGALFVGAGLAVATPASADVLASLNYNDLSGNFSPTGVGTGNFNAHAADLPGLRSYGRASRVVPTVGDAVFAPGFESGANPANFVLDLSVLITGATTASGNGTFEVTDADGDKIVGNVTELLPGQGWTTPGFGLMFYNGHLTNVTFVDNGVADGTFDGTDGGSWSMNMPGTPPFEGQLVSLVFNLGGGFFSAPFVDVSSSLSAQIVPTPGALVLAGLAGAFMSRRRRA